MEARPVKDQYVFRIHIEVERKQRAQLAYLSGTLEGAVQLHHPAPLVGRTRGRRLCATSEKMSVVLGSHAPSL